MLYSDDGVDYPRDFSFFIVQLPAPQDTNSSVEISYVGKKLLSFNPSGQLLVDTINQTAESSFKFLPKLTRDSLLVQAKSINKGIQLCKLPTDMPNPFIIPSNMCVLGIENRLLLLRKQMDFELNDSEPSDLSLIAKAEAPRDIDEVILQTIPNISLPAPNKNLNINVLPSREACNNSKLFTGVSVTQGVFGSVN